VSVSVRLSAARRERAVLVGLQVRGRSAWDLEDALDELGRLAVSAGAEVVGTFVQRRERPEPALLIGRGKAAELAALLEARGAHLAIFEHELTPGQERNLAKTLATKVLDRTDLILDIFAQRARTSEGRLQVEVAQLTRLLPRLVGKGLELSRLGGGIGTRGPGETRLESDRRRVRERLTALRLKIAAIGRHRALYQRRRRKAPIPVVALVGYTNAGKSTLLNRLAQADVFVADQPFATLDPTTRRIALPGGRQILLTDTVGFIQKLPTSLIAAFRATLEEISEADLLLHVVDITHRNAQAQAKAVLGTLEEIQAGEIPMVTALNKIDLRPDPAFALDQVDEFERAVAVSALTGAGTDALLNVIEFELYQGMTEVEARIPYSQARLAALMREHGQLLEERHLARSIVLHGRVPNHLLTAYRPYMRNDAVRQADSTDPAETG
jgi:GTP-binding protein HflX